MPPTALAARFGLILDILCRAVAARGPKGVLAVPLLILLWTRLRRTAARFAALAAAVEAGAPPPPRRIGRKRASTDRPTAARLPQRFAWLLRPVPEAAGSAAQLRHFLAEPEVEALIAADPRFGRLLRPLCRTLGLRPPPHLRLPPRPRPPRRRHAKPATSPAPRWWLAPQAIAPPPPASRPWHVPARAPPSDA